MSAGEDGEGSRHNEHYCPTTLQKRCEEKKALHEEVENMPEEEPKLDICWRVPCAGFV